MKNKIVYIFIFIFLITGCVKSNVDMKLETNNSFNIVITNGYQASRDIDLLSDEDKQKYINNGYSLEDYKEDNYTGIKLSLTVDDINSISDSNVGVVELSDIASIKVDNLKIFKSKKVENGTLYTADFTYNLLQENIDTYTSSDTSDVESYKSIMDLKYSITLPVKVEDSNCTSVDGNTYIWKLEFGKINEIKYSFIINDSNITKEKINYENNKESNNIKKEKNTNNIYNIISSFIGIGVLVLIIVLYYSFKKKISNKFKKKKRKNGYHYKAPESIREKK